jgi:hypothetical protein
MGKTFDYVKRCYEIPFIKRGMAVSVEGRTGVVTAPAGASIRVRFNGMKKSVPCHPTWKTIYCDNNGSILADFYEKQGEVECLN